MTSRLPVLSCIFVMVSLAYFAPSAAHAQPTSLDTLRHFDVQPLGSYAALWGYTAPDGREYALLGVNGSTGVYPGGTSIIDITNINNVHQVAFIGGPNSQWREMKTYRQYGYVVSEGGGGVQIINLSQLPDTAWLVNSFNYVQSGKNTLKSHTISIHDGFMYLSGCANWSPGGILIFDLRADPENPVFVGQYQPEYVHDVYVLRDTLYASAIYSGGGLYIADATNKANIQTIGIISYSGSGTHNAWVTKNRSHVITTDEIGTTSKNLKFWNITNLPAIPALPAATYTPSPTEIVHNVTVRGDYAYVAWYSAGVRVVNISNPASPANAGGYDTSPSTSGYNGVWGVYPYFPSGKIIAGDIQNGLWVFSFSDLLPREPVQLIEPAQSELITGLAPVSFRWTKAANTVKDPHYYTLSISGPGVDLSVDVHDSVYTLNSFAGFQAGGTYHWHVQTRDEFNDTPNPDTLSFLFGLAPAAPALHLPGDQAQSQSVNPTLRWFRPIGATAYRTQLATDSLFVNIVVDDSTLADTSLAVGPLLYETVYYWRVQAKNALGVSGFSSPWRFTTAIAPPAAPMTLLPADGESGQSTTPTLVWSSSPTAVSYVLQVSTDSLFNALVVDESALADTSLELPPLANLTTYFWRVNGTNGGGAGPFSSVSQFTTVIAPPAIPVLVSPANGTTDLPTSVHLIWRYANAAGEYRLQVARDSLFSLITFDDSTLVDTTAFLEMLLPGVRYYWRVRAQNEVWTSGWSESREFSVTLQTVREYEMRTGWNLISLPLSVADPSVGALFPQAVSPLYAFSGSQGYLPAAIFQSGKGYWLKFADSLQAVISGELQLADSVELQPGWNLIGMISEPIPVAGIVTVPAGLVVSDFFGYNSAYEAADTLQSARGYWVKAGGKGLLILNCSSCTTRSGSTPPSRTSSAHRSAIRN